jgi:hypothetical protein
MIVRKKKELLLAIYNPSMTLTERRIFEFAIYKWQTGDQSFRKKDLEGVFGNIGTRNVQKSVEKLNDIFFSIEEDGIIEKPIFNDISYLNGVISFEWSDYIKQYI